MKKRLFTDRNISIILWIAFAVMIVCVTMTFLHVFDIKNLFESNSKEAFEGQTQTIVRQIEQKISDVKDISGAFVDGVSDSLSKEDIQKAIVNEERYVSDCKFYYVGADSTLIGANSFTHLENLYTSLNSISKYEYSNNYTCIDAEEYLTSALGEKSIAGVRKLYDKDGDAYYLLTVASLEDIIKDESFDYINTLGCFVIVDDNGELICKSKSYDDYFENSFNVFDGLKNISSNSSIDTGKINGIQKQFHNTPYASEEIVMGDGRESLLYYGKLEGADCLHYIAFFEAGLIESKISGAATRSYIVCGILMAIMIGLVIYIWIDLNRSNQVITKLAYIDDVTHGFNYNYFKRNAMRIIHARRELPYIIMRFDVLNFRYINESYGHEKADLVLKAVIDVFDNVFSNPNELCVRINSDQFVALAINTNDFDEKFNSFVKGVTDAAANAGVKYPIRFKVGNYQIRKDDNSIDLIIDHANVARKSVDVSQNVLSATYSENIINDIKKVDAIESEMARSLSLGEFKVYVQPKWDIIEDRLIGGEALVRWIKNDGTIIYPSDFIPIFESNGFIEKLDFFMLEQLCINMREIRKDERYEIPTISVNQSRVLVNSPDYVRNVEKVLQRYDADVSLLQLEITETVFFDQKSKIIDVVNELKGLGLELAMDDFGSGYSSLNVLKDVPFNVLKIDKEFFDESIVSPASLIILQKILEMANFLKIDVICEGVETKEQVDMLRELGCKEVQGYFYGKPIPFEEFVEKYCKVPGKAKKHE